jgi:hypothetical protein
MTAAAVPQASLFSIDVPLPPKQENSLASTAMLWSVNISRWWGWKYDRAESEEVARRHNAGKKRARVNKSIVPTSELEEITQAIGRARRDHYFLTLPWTDDGWRVLPGATYMEHTDKMRDNESAFWAAVDRLVGRFEEIVRRQRENPDELGTLFAVEDYPGMRGDNGILRFAFPHELRDEFSFSTDVKPMPSADDFRVDISDSERERLKRQIADSVQASLRAATRDLWQRLYDVVSHMSKKLAEYNGSSEDDKKPKLYKSMVGNIVELVDVLPKLNVAGDRELDRMAETARCSLIVDTEDLRQSEAVRTDVARAAAEIAQRMAAYMGIPNPQQAPS